MRLEENGHRRHPQQGGAGRIREEASDVVNETDQVYDAVVIKPQGGQCGDWRTVYQANECILVEHEGLEPRKEFQRFERFDSRFREIEGANTWSLAVG